MDFISRLIPKGMFENSRDQATLASGPFLTLSQLTEGQLVALNSMKIQFPDESEEVLIGYLKFRNFNVGEASNQIATTVTWKASLRPSIVEVAPFLRSAPGCGGPDGCIVVLEDMKGNCARDIYGRPIVACIGMLHGSMLEMQFQMIYALRRAALYSQPGNIQSNCTVIEVAPRPNCKTTFRFPDTNTKALMEMQKQHFPGTLSSTTHFCGIPTAVTWAFTLCKPFMDKEAYENMILRPDFSHLPEYITKENLLKEWGGSFEFNINEYISWRASEEGLMDMLDGSVRQYDPSAETDGIDSMESQLLSTSAQELFDSTPPPLHSGTVAKRGNGQGMFANYKWKDKLLCVLSGGLLVYFDKPDISPRNKPSRVINLLGSYVEMKIDDSEHPHSFQLVTPGRNYLFSCSNAEDLSQWNGVIRAAAETAVVIPERK